MENQSTKMLRLATIALIIMAASIVANAQTPATGTWQKVKNQPTFKADTALLLTDGSVMAHEYNSRNWWRLIPASSGSYVNGTWKQTAPMQSGYEPLYFASAVLPDGRLLVEGGEYNDLSQDETNIGSIYDPVADKWTAVNPPAGWSTIGDSPAIVLPNGTFMMGQGGQPAKLQVLFNASNLTWTTTGSGKADGFSEEGFALTPGGKVLTVDCEDGTNSELYDPASSKWTSAGSTINVLPNSGGLGIVPEMGPLVQRPDGTIVAFGATTHTSIFNTASGTWAKGPDFPGGDDMADGPGTLLPNGNVLVYTSPGVFSGTGTFYEFNGTSFAKAPDTASSTRLESWQGRLLGLPTGQVLYVPADGANIDAEIYTTTGGPQNSWRPRITGGPHTVTRGSTYTISGTQFNGLSAGSTYGDDAQNATNYPIVVIRNKASKHFSFTRTHDHSTMAIATGSATVSTMFDIPANAETGASTIYVVANGIASAGKSITVQ
ncbi:MAG: hypothetical protein ACRD3L_08005 [Terriglobales bacterium]